MAITLRPVRPVTDEELLALSERNPEYQFERDAKGELIVTPTGSEGSRASGEVFGQLRDWNRRASVGVVFDASGGFDLPDGSCFSPDASWVPLERWNALGPEQRERFAPLCPDAVFEVRSKSNTPRELREKMRAYLANGARIAVFIDPYERIVELYRPGQESQVFTNPATVALDPELSGFVLELMPIFIV